MSVVHAMLTMPGAKAILYMYCTLQWVVCYKLQVVVSELEELKKRVHVPSRSSSSSRSPPPTVSTAAGTTTRPPPYPGHRPQGVSAR